jgi:hypothetical protein
MSADLATARHRIRAKADTQGVAPNAAREVAATVLLDALWVKVDGPHLQRDLFAEDVGDRREFLRFLQAWWPRLTPPKVLSWLKDPARVPILDAQAAQALAASYQRHDDWAVDDVPLLDELGELLGEAAAEPAANPADKGWQIRELTSGTQIVENFVLSCGLHDGWSLYAPGLPTPIALAGPAIDNDAIAAAWRWAQAVILREGHKVVGWTDGFDPHGEEGYVPVLAEPLPVAEPEDQPADADHYAHVILDEAQDLSPMECRMIARRAEFASMTIVGDLGQATHPLSSDSWPQLLARLGRRDARTLDLRTGYRVPQAIADYAVRYLAPGITATHSYRPGGDLVVQRVDGSADDMAAAIGVAVREAGPDGTVAVVTADNAIPGLLPLIDERASFVPASLIKGLEYDHVIVVEPGDIVAAEPRGYSRLYVALTRAVARLVVLHRTPLPAFLRD